MFEVIATAPRRKLAVACMHCRMLCPDEGLFLQLIGSLQRGYIQDAKEVLRNWVAPAAARLALPRAQALADGMAGQGLALPHRIAGAAARDGAFFYPVSANIH